MDGERGGGGGGGERAAGSLRRPPWRGCAPVPARIAPARHSAHPRSRARTPRPHLFSQIVSPGDRVAPLPTTGALRVGPGLDADGDWLVADAPGVVREGRGGVRWVASRARRYTPTPGDTVVGLVTDKGGDAYGVDVGGAFPASLPALAFEGATRRNRPPLGKGDLVLARVVSANRDVDAELACVDDAGRVRTEGRRRGAGGRGARRAAPPPHPTPLASRPASARSAPASCCT